MGRLTEEERLAHRDHPEYDEGFHDAARGDPLFTDANLPYRAGWEAYYVVRELMESAGFTGSGLNFSKTTVVPASRQSSESER